MLSQSCVVLLCCLVEHDVNEVESRKKSRGQMYVFDNRFIGIVSRVDRICSSQDGGSGVETTDDTCLGDRDCLLLHGFKQDCSVVFVHLVELIDAADASVTQN